MKNQDFNAKKFGEVVRAKRKREDMTLRELSSLIKIAFSTLHRVENGGTPDVTAFLKLNQWVGEPIKVRRLCLKCGGLGVEE